MKRVLERSERFPQTSLTEFLVQGFERGMPLSQLSHVVIGGQKVTEEGGYDKSARMGSVFDKYIIN